MRSPQTFGHQRLEDWNVSETCGVEQPAGKRFEVPWSENGVANFCLGAKVKLLILIRKRQRANEWRLLRIKFFTNFLIIN